MDTILEDYIATGLVEIIDARGKKAFQMEAYTEYFNNNKDKYDWICYFDIDEYLAFNHCKNIKQYLSKPVFAQYDMIHINWKIYDDNEQLYYSSKPVWERFTHPMDPDRCFKYDFPENDHIKSIIRTDIKHDVKFTNPHTIDEGKEKFLRVCDNTGMEVKNEPFVHPYNWDEAYLMHYKCKTIDEYVRIRLTRGRATTTKDFINLDMFKNHNNWTADKEKICKILIGHLGKRLVGYDSVVNSISTPVSTPVSEQQAEKKAEKKLGRNREKRIRKKMVVITKK